MTAAVLTERLRAPVRRQPGRGRGRPRRARRARSTASSAPTAPASPPPCGCCARCCCRPRAGPRWPATTWPPSPRRVRLRIGVALQDAALDDKQTGRELLRLQGRLYGLRRGEIERAPRRPDAGLVDIGDALDDRIGTYSGGMKRRLDLAAALVHNPDVLFLDEPTTGLDPISRAKVWEEVRRLNERAGHDDLPHHPVPGGGRPAGRPGRHHQRRPHRGRRLARRAEADASARTSSSSRSTVTTDAGRGGARRSSTSSSPSTSPAPRSWPARPTAPPPSARWPWPWPTAGIQVRTLTLRTPTLDDVFLELTGDHIQEAER